MGKFTVMKQIIQISGAEVQREEMALATERKRQSVLRMELEWAKRGCRARSTKQRARLERLEALKAGKAPVSDATLEIEATAARMGRKTVELHHISKRYGEKVLIDDFDYIVLKNQRLGIIGPNGCGKSTLIKIIAGLIEPDSGSVEIGETIQLGYFAQEVPDMNTEQRVIDYIKDVAEYLRQKTGRSRHLRCWSDFCLHRKCSMHRYPSFPAGRKKDCTC